MFTDFGSDVKHLSFDEYLKTFGDNISDKMNVFSDSTEAFNPLESIISGLICGQLMESPKQSKQLFFYEIDSQIIDYKFEANRPVVLMGLGSLGFAFVKQLVRIGVKYLILVDNDSVHKYNLRHNLFRESEIGIKKCEVVKQFVVNYDNKIKVEAFTARAQQASNQFFEAMVSDNAVIVSTVDNTESKRFLSKVCLNHCLPLIDVGIDRHMFHIQPIVPHLTETYFTYSDPSDPEYPLCVLKSFPQIIEHCIQWSKTKVL